MAAAEAPKIASGEPIALVLGAGGARGLAQIGVIEALQARGMNIVAIAGASSGALVGGACAAGKLDDLRDWILGTSRSGMLRLLDPGFGRPALFTGEATLHKMWTFVFNFCYDTTPLWYLYMLIGLYLIMPLISPWLERASRRELQSVLAIWGVTLLLPYVKMLAPALGYTGNYGNTGLYGVCDWNEFGTFHYVSGFAGYLVLAFYLVKFPPAWNWRKTLGICIPTFLAGYLATGLGYVVMQKHFPGNYAYLEIVWYFAGINVFMMTAPVFILVQKAAARPRAWLSRLAGATFGIYLCHFIFVQAGYDLVQRIPGLPALARIALIACGAFAVSWAVVRLMQRWSVTRRLVE